MTPLENAGNSTFFEASKGFHTHAQNDFTSYHAETFLREGRRPRKRRRHTAGVIVWLCCTSAARNRLRMQKKGQFSVKEKSEFNFSFLCMSCCHFSNLKALVYICYILRFCGKRGTYTLCVETRVHAKPCVLSTLYLRISLDRIYAQTNPPELHLPAPSNCKKRLPQPVYTIQRAVLPSCFFRAHNRVLRDGDLSPRDVLGCEQRIDTCFTWMYMKRFIPRVVHFSGSHKETENVLVQLLKKAFRSLLSNSLFHATSLLR